MNNTIRTLSAILVTVGLVTSGATLAHADEADSGGPWVVTGEVIETMDVASYTYLRVDSGEEKVWAAAPGLELAVGDQVKVPEGTLMAGYHSKSLDRTFERIHFVAFVVVDRKDADADSDDIEKVEGGVTIAEIFDGRADLGGKDIAVRGKVVKFTQKIMGRNWLHLRDGTSGANNEDDLTVTTEARVSMGDTVVVRGVLQLDKDFGAGYKYDVIIENASVIKE